MKSDNGDLREAYRAYADSGRSADRGLCPSPEALAESFSPGASRRKKKKIIDHLLGCPDCLEEFRFIMDFQRAPLATCQTQASGLADRDVSPAIPKWRYATAFLGACIILSTIWIYIRNIDVPYAERAGGAEVILVYPTASHPQSTDLIFQWEPFASSQHYVVELFDEALLPVWASSTIQDLTVSLPADRAREMKAGQTYFWMVTAYAEKSKISESQLVRFNIVDR